MSVAAEPTAHPRAALMQPTFLPWIGYFALMRAADLFVVLDDFQFVRRSFHQRNRLFVARDKIDWVTAPVDHAPQGAPINAVKPRVPELKAKLRATLLHVYAKSNALAELLPEIDAWLDADHATLADLNLGFIQLAARWLDIATPIVKSSTLGTSGKRSARIAATLHAVGAKTYLSARGAAEYMFTDGVFPLADIHTLFQSYEPAPYEQTQSRDFIPYLSALDLVLQIGRRRAREVLEAGERPYLPWAEMASRMPAVHQADLTDTV